ARRGRPRLPVHARPGVDLALRGADGDRSAAHVGLLAAAAPHAGPALARPLRAPARRLARAVGRLPAARDPVRARRRLPRARHRVRAPDPVRGRAHDLARPAGGNAMRRRIGVVLGIAAANAGLAWALESGALRALPPAVRVLLAFAVLIGVPGAGWARAIGVRPPGGRALASGWAVAYG